MVRKGVAVEGNPIVIGIVRKPTFSWMQTQSRSQHGSWLETRRVHGSARFGGQTPKAVDFSEVYSHVGKAQFGNSAPLATGRLAAQHVHSRRLVMN